MATASVASFEPGFVKGRGGAAIVHTPAWTPRRDERATVPAAIHASDAAVHATYSTRAMTLDDDQLWIFGGADRMGDLFSDLHVVTVKEEIRSGAQTLAAAPSVKLGWQSIHESDAGRDGTSGAQVPGLAGSAACNVRIGDEQRIIVFGGVNFVQQKVYNGLFEYRVPTSIASAATPQLAAPGSSSAARKAAAKRDAATRWRVLQAVEHQTVGRKPKTAPSASSSQAAITDAPSASESPAASQPQQQQQKQKLVTGDIPPGRTGHTLVCVPNPIVLPHDLRVEVIGTAASPAASSGGSGGDGSGGSGAVPLSTVPGFVAMSSPTGTAGASASTQVWLFGGSSPVDGPMNDLFRLTITATPASGGDIAVDIDAFNSGTASGSGDAPSAASSSSPASAFDWQYNWEEIGTDGPAPERRELHAAFVRPAVVQLVSPSAAAAPAEGEAPTGGSVSVAVTGRDLVRVLQPPVLIVFGGRNEDHGGIPRPDICILDLMAHTWTRPVRAPFACAAGAYCSSPDALFGYCFGGQNKENEITSSLLRLDLRCGLPSSLGAHLLASSEDTEPPSAPHLRLLPPTDPTNIKVSLVKLPADKSVEPRFASAAACTAHSASVTLPVQTPAAAEPAPSPLPSTVDPSSTSRDLQQQPQQQYHAVHVFGGMTIEADLAQVVTMVVPVPA